MVFVLADVPRPEFPIPQERAELSERLFDDRNADLRARVKSDWIIVWGDREHFANLHFLTNFDPRFEEALLLIAPDGKRTLIVGNEGDMYKPVVKGDCAVVLAQVFSLPGQRRGQSPQLVDIFRDLGLSKAASIGLVGWKSVTEAESLEALNTFVPSYILRSLLSVSPDLEMEDVTDVLTNPEYGLRAVNTAEMVAYLEWGAARASEAVSRIVHASRPGVSELDVVAQMGYAGEPLTAHVMYASGAQELTALRSPSARVMQTGDAIFTAVGYWGGLSCRAGILRSEDKDFTEGLARGYFSAIAAWYENVKVGANTGDVATIAVAELDKVGLRPSLNPGHLTSTDEWLDTTFSLDGNDSLRSGMALQCDIIPEPLPQGVSLNCEDGVVLADEQLRKELRENHPDVWDRFTLRRAFMTDRLGIDLDPSVLPMSNTPALFAPLFLAPDRVYVRS